MYLLENDKRTWTLNFNQEQKTLINSKLQALQEKGSPVETVKDAFLLLAESAENSAEPIQPQPGTIIAPDGEIGENLSVLIDAYLVKFPNTNAENLWNIFLSALEKAISEPKAPEIPEPEIVEKTVERELSENEILVVLKDDQRVSAERKREIFTFIQEFRNKKFQEENTLGDIILNLALTEGAVLDFNGEYETGISLFGRRKR